MVGRWLGGRLRTSRNISRKFPWHQPPPIPSRRQLHRKNAAEHVKNMWLLGSFGVSHSGQFPLHLRTSTPEGSRPRTNCQWKILIFIVTFISQRRLSSSGPGVAAMALYRDLDENNPFGSRCHEIESFLRE